MSIRIKSLLRIAAFAINMWVLYYMQTLLATESDIQMAFVGAIIGAVGSAVGGILGSIRAAKQRRALNAQKRQLDQWYRGEMGTNYLDRADSRSMLKRIRDMYAERARKQDTQNI